MEINCVKKSTLVLLSVLFVNFAESQVLKPSDACNWLSKSIDFIWVKQNAKTIISKSTDNCVIALIDKLVDSSNCKNGREYIKVLGEFRRVSDGYVSEYLSEIGSKLFYVSFDNLIKEICNDTGETNSNLERIVVQSIGSEISDAINRTKEKEKLELFIRKKKTHSHLSKAKKKYLDILKQKIFIYAAQDES